VACKNIQLHFGPTVPVRRDPFSPGSFTPSPAFTKANLRVHDDRSARSRRPIFAFTMTDLAVHDSPIFAFTMTDLAVHDGLIFAFTMADPPVHDGPIFAFTMALNSQQADVSFTSPAF
jgi:hypothetical protein